MRNRKITDKTTFAMLLASVLAPAGLMADAIDDLPAGQWLELPNTRMDAVAAPRLPSNNGTGVTAVMSAWSGAAYDGERDRFIVWGGGHGDYSGNEVYVFDLATLKWRRASERSTDVGGDELSGLYPDGTPRSFHTMDNLEYIPAPLNKLCATRPASSWPTAMGFYNGAICFDVDTGKWTRMADFPSSFGTPGGSGITGWDPVRKKMWYQTVRTPRKLYAWKPFANQTPEEAWESHSTGQLEHFANGALGGDKMVAIHSYDGTSGQVVVWDLNNPGVAALQIQNQTTGPKEIERVKGAGLEYDPESKRFVAWKGGSEVYSLDVDKKQWAMHAAGSAVTPGPSAGNGTYGRFRYIPSKRVFILVNRVDANIFVYRLNPNNGTPILRAHASRAARFAPLDFSGTGILIRKPGTDAWSDTRGRILPGEPPQHR